MAFPQTDITLHELSKQNRDRADRWHKDAHDKWIGSDWSNALCGETGEAANIVKKLRRHETGIESQHNTPPPGILIEKLEKEIADIILYADLLAWYYGINITTAVRNKFNEVSIAQDFPERL